MNTTEWRNKTEITGFTATVDLNLLNELEKWLKKNKKTKRTWLEDLAVKELGAEGEKFVKKQMITKLKKLHVYKIMNMNLDEIGIYDFDDIWSEVLKKMKMYVEGNKESGLNTSTCRSTLVWLNEAQQYTEKYKEVTLPEMRAKVWKREDRFEAFSTNVDLELLNKLDEWRKENNISKREWLEQMAKKELEI